MQEEVMVFVRPAGGGWQVETEFAHAPLMFLSGAKAEVAAHALARRLSDGGAPAQVVIEDRLSQVVGEKRYPPTA